MMAAAARKGKPVLLHFLLDVADESPPSIPALANLKQMCEKHLSGGDRIQEIDVLAHPDVARINQIGALSTLVRRSPKPVRTAIGDLSDTRRLLARPDLLPQNYIREWFNGKETTNS